MQVVLRADAQLFLPGVVEGVLGPVCCAQLLPGLFKPGAVRGAELTCQLTAALGFGPAVRANQSEGRGGRGKGMDRAAP